MARSSKNARVINFFRDEPYAAAAVVYELVQDTMKTRRKLEGHDGTEKKARKKRATVPSVPGPTAAAPGPTAA